MVHEIIDTAANTAAKAVKLNNAGVRTVIRYYNFMNSSVLPEKRMELPEAQAIAAAGMRIAAVFEARNNSLADFSLPQGEKAGARALTFARDKIGQPASSAIYFAVDVDFVKQSQLSAVKSYFEGVAKAMQAAPAAQRYSIGIYGSGLVLSHIKSLGFAQKFWLAQSTGWSGFQAFKSSAQWHLLQGPVTSVAGVPCDSNVANPALPDFGAFTI